MAIYRNHLRPIHSAPWSSMHAQHVIVDARLRAIFVSVLRNGA